MKKNVEISPKIETLFGTRDENLHLMEDGFSVAINLKSDSIEIEGAASDVARAEQVFIDFEHLQRAGHQFNNGDLGSLLRVVTTDPSASLRGLAEAGRQRSFGKRQVQPKSVNQRRYLDAIENNDMVFGIGPAGTGKTYLAVAMAISALVSKRVNRIFWRVRRSKPASAWDFCRALCKRRSIPISARSMTRCMKCWSPREWIVSWRRMSLRSLPSPSCADAP